MRKHTTRTKIERESSNVIKVPYCHAQYLLTFTPTEEYNAGTYGWNFDVYRAYGVTICTGYRNMPGRDALQVDEYDKRAEKVLHDYSVHDPREQVEQLLKEFCLKNGGTE